MDSDESYHSESQFYYPNEMTTDNKKEDIGAISKEENQQNVVYNFHVMKFNSTSVLHILIEHANDRDVSKLTPRW